MSTPHYKQCRIQAFQSTNLGKFLISINRASPTGARPNGRKTYDNADLDFTIDPTETIIFDSFNLLLSDDLVIEKSTQDNGLILVSDLNEVVLDSDVLVVGTVNGSPVSYDLTSELLTMFEWFLYDEDAKYCIRIVRQKNDNTYEHLFCGDFRRKDFKFESVGIISEPETATELVRKKVTIQSAPLFARVEEVLTSEIEWSISDLVGSDQIKFYGGMQFTGIAGDDDTQHLYNGLISGFNTGSNPIFNNSLGGTKATITLLASANAATTTSINVNGKIYTFQNTLTNVDGHVTIGANAAATLRNLLNAINLTGVPGTTYAAATTKHTTVECDPSQVIVSSGFLNTGSHMTMQAQLPGVSGNAFTSSGTSDGRLSFSSALFSGGVDPISFSRPGYIPFRYNNIAFPPGNATGFWGGVFGISIFGIFQKLLEHDDVGYTISGQDTTPITFLNQKYNSGSNTFDIDETTPVDTIADEYIQWNDYFGINPNVAFTVTSITDATPNVVTLVFDGTSSGQRLIDYGIDTGSKIRIMFGTGKTSVNEVWEITKISENSFSLNGSVADGNAYINGAIVFSEIDTPVTYGWDSTNADALKELLYGTGFVAECDVDSSGDPTAYLRDRRSITGVPIPASFASSVTSDATTEQDFIPAPIIALNYKGDNDKIYVQRKPLPNDSTINIVLPFRNHALADIQGNVYGRHLVYNSELDITGQGAMRFQETGAILNSNVPAGWFPGSLVYLLKSGADAEAILPADIFNDAVAYPTSDALFAASIVQYKSDTTERTSVQFASGQNLLWTMAQFYANALGTKPKRQVSRIYNRVNDDSDTIQWIKPGVTDSFFWDGAVRDWVAIKATISLKKETIEFLYSEQPDYSTLTEYQLIPEGTGKSSGGSQGASPSGGGSQSGGTPALPAADVVLTDPITSTRNRIKPPVDVVELLLTDSSSVHTSDKFVSDNLDGSIIYAGLKGDAVNNIHGFFAKTIHGFILYNVSGTPSQIEFYNTGNTFKTILKGNTSIAADVSFTLPNADGSSGFLLQTNGSGVLAFIDPSTLLTNAVIINPSTALRNLITPTANGVRPLEIKGKAGSSSDLILIQTSGSQSILKITSGGLINISGVVLFNAIGGATNLSLDTGSGFDNGNSGDILTSGGTGGLLAWVTQISLLTTAIIIDPLTDVRNLINPSGDHNGLIIRQGSGSIKDNLEIQTSGSVITVALNGNNGNNFGDVAGSNTGQPFYVRQFTGGGITSIFEDGGVGSSNITEWRDASHGQLVLIKANGMFGTVRFVGAGTLSPLFDLHIKESVQGTVHLRAENNGVINDELLDKLNTTDGANHVLHSWVTSSNKAYLIEGDVIARQTNNAGGNQHKAYGAHFFAVYHNIAGVLAQAGNPTILGKIADIPLAVIVLVVNGINLELQVNGGGAGVNVTWYLHNMEFIEV